MPNPEPCPITKASKVIYGNCKLQLNRSLRAVGVILQEIVILDAAKSLQNDAGVICNTLETRSWYSGCSAYCQAKCNVSDLGALGRACMSGDQPSHTPEPSTEPTLRTPSSFSRHLGPPSSMLHRPPGHTYTGPPVTAPRIRHAPLLWPESGLMGWRQWVRTSGSEAPGGWQDRRVGPPGVGTGTSWQR